MKRLIAKRDKPDDLPRPQDRYTRIVTMMKFTLPGLAFAITVVVLLWPNFASTGKQASEIARDDLAPANLGNFEMESLVYEATDDRNRPYRLTATKAWLKSQRSTTVALEYPRATVRLSDGDHVRISARRGHFDRKKNRLNLTGKVSVHQGPNYSFRTDQATIDMRTNAAWGDRTVHASGPDTTISAEGFRIVDRGARVIFIGRSRVLLQPDSQDLRELSAPEQDPGAAQGDGQ